MTKSKPKLSILFFIISLASISAILFTPGLVAIAGYFSVSYVKAEQTVFAFLFGYTIGQLLYGPLANRFGRKKALLMGISLHIFGALLILLFSSSSIFSLVVLSIFIMALGSASGLKISFTMLGDAFSQKEARKRTSILSISFAIMPALGATIGGFLVQRFNWQSCFAFLLFYGIAVLILSFFLPETSFAIDKKSLKFTSITKGYLAELKNAPEMLTAVIWGLSTALIYVFSAVAPFIGISYIGMRTELYGLLYLIPALGILIGGFVSRALVEKIEAVTSIFWGLLITFLAALFQWAFFYQGMVNPWTLFIPMPFALFGGCLIFSNASALGISLSHNKSNASSIMNFTNMLTATLLVLLINAFPISRPIVLPAFFVALCIIQLGLLLFLRTFTLKPAKN